MNRQKRNEKYKLINQPVTFLKIYMNFLVPVILIISVYGVVTGIVFNSYTSYVLMVSDIIYCGLALANIFLVRDLDKMGLASTEIFLAFQIWKALFALTVSFSILTFFGSAILILLSILQMIYFAKRKDLFLCTFKDLNNKLNEVNN